MSEPLEVFKQNDKRWGKTRLGERGSKSTVGGAGCNLLAFVDHLRTLGIDPDATPLTVLERSIAAPGRCWQGNMAVLPALARLYGLDGDELVRAPPQPAQEMRALILRTLDKGGRLTAWVDHDSSLPDGDPEGDHFVAIRRLEGDRLVYADSASGIEDSLDRRTLTGNTTWETKDGPVVKVYQALSVRAFIRRP